MAAKQEYEITPVTKDYFRVKNKEGTVYRVDLAMKTCSCPDFQMQPQSKKAKYKCKHIKICQGLR